MLFTEHISAKTDIEERKRHVALAASKVTKQLELKDTTVADL